MDELLELYKIDVAIRHIEDNMEPGACYKFADGTEYNTNGSLAKLKLARDAQLDKIKEIKL